MSLPIPNRGPSKHAWFNRPRRATF